MNQCAVCGEDFGSVSAFDAHRVGEHDFLFTEGVHFDPPRYDGRRCLEPSELQEAGWVVDRYRRWRLPGLRDRAFDRVEL